MGKAIPYGVYDMGANEGWVSVGDDADTAGFAVASIKQWWIQMGKQRSGSPSNRTSPGQALLQG